MSEMNKVEDYKFEGIIQKIEKKLIKFMVGLVETSSPLSPKLTEILGYLLLHGQLTQAQLVELTGFSIGTISSNLNQMISLNIVRKELIPKARTYKYIFLGGEGSIESQAGFMKLDIITNALNFFMQKLEELEKLKGERGYDLLQERVEALLNYFKWHKIILEEKYTKLGVI
ncbi:MAG: winged helix-turn-helix transcriptional regulator [Promethearchaeota archaeon]